MKYFADPNAAQTEKNDKKKMDKTLQEIAELKSVRTAAGPA